MPEYAPDSIRRLFDAIDAGFGGRAILAGIVGDSAHRYGYHRGRDYCTDPNDYSTQDAVDRRGDGQAACALDISWQQAADQYTASKRLLNASKARDPRLRAMRSWYGSTDGVKVCGYDTRYWYPATSDSSHLWHIHVSLTRETATSWDAIAPIADVMTAAAPASEDDDMPSHVSVNRSTPLKLKGGQQVDVQFDVENIDTAGVFSGTKSNPVARLNLNNAYYVSTFTCQIKGFAKPGSSVHSALVFCDLSGSNTGQAPWVEHPATNNDVLDILDVRSYKAGKDRGIKMRVKAPADVTIDACQWRVHFWRL